MSQIHECYVSANMDAIRNRKPVVFSAVVVHVLVQCALLNHGASIGTLHHLATVTTLIAAMVLLDFLLYLAIVYKQTWADSEMYSRVKLQLFIIYTVVRILNKVLRLFVFASHVSIGLQRRQTQSLLAKANQACRYDR